MDTPRVLPEALEQVVDVLASLGAWLGRRAGRCRGRARRRRGGGGLAARLIHTRLLLDTLVLRSVVAPAVGLGGLTLGDCRVGGSGFCFLLLSLGRSPLGF